MADYSDCRAEVIRAEAIVAADPEAAAMEEDSRRRREAAAVAGLARLGRRRWEAAAGQEQEEVAWEVRAEFAVAVELAAEQTGPDFVQRKAEVEHCRADLA